MYLFLISYLIFRSYGMTPIYKRGTGTRNTSRIKFVSKWRRMDFCVCDEILGNWGYLFLLFRYLVIVFLDI